MRLNRVVIEKEVVVGRGVVIAVLKTRRIHGTVHIVFKKALENSKVPIREDKVTER